jgi:hypothetical protein
MTDLPSVTKYGIVNGTTISNFVFRELQTRKPLILRTMPRVGPGSDLSRRRGGAGAVGGVGNELAK